MEVLSVDVELDVGFFMEFLMIEVLYSNACFSCLFNVEPVSAEGKVGVDEPEEARQVQFRLVPRIVHELQPPKRSLLLDVVLEWSANLSLVKKSAIYESV